MILDRWGKSSEGKRRKTKRNLVTPGAREVGLLLKLNKQMPS